MFRLDERGEVHISLGVIDPRIPLPEKLHVHRLTVAADPSELYIKRIFCDALMTMDDEHIVGSCECSNCHTPMNPFNKFCPNCGAKKKDTIIVGVDENE